MFANPIFRSSLRINQISLLAKYFNTNAPREKTTSLAGGATTFAKPAFCEDICFSFNTQVSFDNQWVELYFTVMLLIVREKSKVEKLC